MKEISLPYAELSEREAPVTQNQREASSLINYDPDSEDEGEMLDSYSSPEAIEQLLISGVESVIFTRTPERAIARERNSTSEIIDDFPESDSSGKRGVAYNTEFDSVSYGELAFLREANPVLYEIEAQKRDRYTELQLITHLGEVHNAELSIIHQSIIDGHIYGKGMEHKPFVEVMQDGTEYVWKHVGTADKQREINEINGYRWIDSVIGDERTPKGTMILSISLQSDNPDGKYWHRFHDVHTKRVDDFGNPFMETRRYTSVLTKQEYLQKMEELGLVKPGEIPQTITAAELLGRPLLLYPKQEIPHASALNALLQGKYDDAQKGLAFGQFLDLQQAMKLHIQSYTRALRRDPYDHDAIHVRYNAIRIAAQKAVKMIKEGRDDVVDVIHSEADEVSIAYYGEQPDLVEEVMTPCGDAGGLEINGANQANMSPFGVAEFAKHSDWMGSLTFNCPVCEHENTRPYGETIRLCQNKSCPDRSAVWCGPKKVTAETKASKETTVETADEEQSPIDKLFQGWLNVTKKSSGNTDGIAAKSVEGLSHIKAKAQKRQEMSEQRELISV